MNQQTAKPNQAMKQTKKSMKHWVAVAMFAAIIVVFALMGFNPARMGDGSTGGGVAATVNDTVIPLSEYNNQKANMEQRMRQQIEQYPEAIRGELMKQQEARLRDQVLENLIMGEVLYQGGHHLGVLAPDTEVRDFILQVPMLQENGRFMKERYQAYLQNMNLRTEDFEHLVRKQIVLQKLQELFVAAATPTREELKRTQELSRQKVAVRFVEIKADDMSKPGFLPDSEVDKYLASNKAEVEKYYKENQVEFTKPETVEARHILIKVDDKRKDPEAFKLVSDLKKQATPANFAQLATQHSEDPGSKTKGGDLGAFQRGRMVKEFDEAAFSLKPGVISEPIKTSFGYHLILVTKKNPGGAEPLAQAQSAIARKLLARAKASEVLTKTKTLVEKGQTQEVESLVKSAGLKWTDSGEFDFSSNNIPKLGDAEAVLTAIVKQKKTSGLVPELISIHGNNYIVDVTEWKQAPEKPEGEEASQMLAYRKSSDLFESWATDLKSKASVDRNSRILQ